MNKGILFAALFLVSGASLQANASDAKDVCEKNIQTTETKIKKSLDKIWEDVDSSVGVEFFIVVLKGNNRMPASDAQSSSAFYAQLLKGIKKTSFDLKDHGLSLDEKKIKKTEELISALEKAENCKQLAYRN